MANPSSERKGTRTRLDARVRARERVTRTSRGSGATPDATPMAVEALDARMLFSADFVPVEAPTDVTLPSAEIRPFEADSASNAAPASVGTSRHELIVVDAAVPDADMLIERLMTDAGTDRSFELLRINAIDDGVSRISAYLASASQSFDAVHVIAHGDDASLQLGVGTLDQAALASRANELARWADALTADADLLLYGCDVAGSEAGRAAGDLAALTGADVAASVDRTGSARLGGDFDLEYRVGKIDASLALSASTQALFEGVLATFTVTNTNDSGAGSASAGDPRCERERRGRHHRVQHRGRRLRADDLADERPAGDHRHGEPGCPDAGRAWLHWATADQAQWQRHQ
ncbi:MAG: DUF4347 domain-containing protein [Burkholderiaceae bacterium]